MEANEDNKVACHSSLFRDVTEVFSIPDEMEYQVCNGSCYGQNDGKKFCRKFTSTLRDETRRDDQNNNCL